MRIAIASLLGITLSVPLLAAPQDPVTATPVGPPARRPAGTLVMPEMYRPVAQQYKELIPGLIDGLKDVDPEVRQYCALALANLGHDALKALTEALTDSSRERRSAAAYALGQMGGQAREALPPLLKVLKDEDTGVRRAAAQALNRIVAQDQGLFGGFPVGMRGIGAPTLTPLNPPAVSNPPPLPQPDPIPE